MPTGVASAWTGKNKNESGNTVSEVMWPWLGWFDEKTLQTDGEIYIIGTLMLP